MTGSLLHIPIPSGRAMTEMRDVEEGGEVGEKCSVFGVQRGEESVRYSEGMGKFSERRLESGGQRTETTEMTENDEAVEYPISNIPIQCPIMGDVCEQNVSQKTNDQLSRRPVEQGPDSNIEHRTGDERPPDQRPETTRPTDQPGGDQGPADQLTNSIMRVAGFGDGAFVVEADESDGTLALYHPEIAVITNVEFDHMEHFESEDDFISCFRHFAGQTRRRIWFCADDARAAEICGEYDYARGYGFGAGAVLRGEAGLSRTGEGDLMRVYLGGELLGEVRIPVPGHHNALNMLGAIGVCLELGVEFGEIAAAMAGIVLPRRRFEQVCVRDGVRVISDYAHHPSEIAALVKTAGAEMGGCVQSPVFSVQCSDGIETRSGFIDESSERGGRGRLAVIFQPHRYTRTLALGEDFPAAFEGVDLLVLVPVYAASERPLAGGMVCDLYAHFRGGGECREKAGLTPLLAGSLEEAWAFLRGELKSGDMLVVAGAGDVEKIAEWAREENDKRETINDKRGMRVGEKAECGRINDELRGGVGECSTSNIEHRTSNFLERISNIQYSISNDKGESENNGTSVSGDGLLNIICRERVNIGRLTTYGVGGSADCFVKVGDAGELAEILRVCDEDGIDFRVLGGGSNLLVSDLGVRGVVARLTGEIFRGIRREGEAVVVGGAVPVAKLLNWAEENSLGGLEFLEGIPATMGGIVRMNGGAFGHEICERVLWIRCLNMAGRECRVDASELSWEYRGCPQLSGMVAVEIGLRMDVVCAADIAAERERIAGCRHWQRGLRCAGSVFRNPEGGYAGEIIEKAGLKGCRIGGAQVCSLHANVITAEKGATASDVMALIQRVQAVVFDKFGVELRREVELWGWGERARETSPVRERARARDGREI